jgi:hypothetical protein
MIKNIHVTRYIVSTYVNITMYHSIQLLCANKIIKTPEIVLVNILWIKQFLKYKKIPL